MPTKLVSIAGLVLLVLDRNLFEIPASEISEAKVTMTLFGGRTVYE